MVMSPSQGWPLLLSFPTARTFCLDALFPSVPSKSVEIRQLLPLKLQLCLLGLSMQKAGLVLQDTTTVRIIRTSLFHSPASGKPLLFLKMGFGKTCPLPQKCCLFLESSLFFEGGGSYLQHMEVPKRGLKWSCSCWSIPQPQQCGIRAMSATYTTGHDNTESLSY